MVDDHKYSIRRIVAYRHPHPEYDSSSYGPLGPDRTYGLILDVRLAGKDEPQWEYSIKNTFTGEVCTVPESEIFHGADREYLDLYRRESIFRSRESPTHHPSEEARHKYWRRALRHFLKTGIPKLRMREESEDRAREQGRDLQLDYGDYVRVRGDLRPEVEKYHGLYGKILSVSPSTVQFLEIGTGKAGLAPGRYRILNTYHIRLDTGEEADFYDVEIKTVYTTHGRRDILNWRAACFLAEAFGDELPYQPELEFLSGHIFTRSELEEKTNEELAELLIKMLFVKGQATIEELNEKRDFLERSPRTYLVDQILAVSRFDMSKNRPLTDDEIQATLLAEARLKDLLQ